jgi:putative spermidine/putrescine transport system ATP-binding protein
MTVAGNVGYGLRVRKVAKAERQQRVEAALAQVRLEGFGGRRPDELSGGQRQRVALARALVNRPRVLLLDEPLGALDRQLRQEMQVELKAIQAEVGITFVVVTHDQEEALTMSDRIAVLRDGRIEQVGAPAEVYERPANPFVAGFIGTSNVLAGPVAAELVGEEGIFTVRPEKIHLLDPDAETPAGHCQAAGTVRDVAYAGPVTRLTVRLEAGGELVVLQQNLSTTSAEVAALAGSRVKLVWRPEHNFRLSPAPVPAPTGG